MLIQNDEKNDFGAIKIHNNVIASIAYLATLETDGVSRICDDVRSTLTHLLGKKTKSGAIGVRSEKPEGVSVTIPLVVKYGFNIPEVALKIQERVKATIEEATNLSVKDIIIKIKGVER